MNGRPPLRRIVVLDDYGDAAGAAARAHAIGLSYEPPRGSIEVQTSAGLVTATARIPAVFGTMSSEAIFPVETP